MIDRFVNAIPGSFCVAGVDAARDHIGAVKIVRDLAGPVSVLECAIRGQHSFLSRHKVTTVLADFINTIPKPNLIVVEDYTMQLFSMVSFSMGEMGGIVRLKLFYAGVPILLNPPNLMRYFCGVMPKIKSKPGKLAIGNFAFDCGFFSSQEYSLDRENCTDAFVHALMGAIWLGVETDMDVNLVGCEHTAIQKLVDGRSNRYIIPGLLEGIQIYVSYGTTARTGK